MSNSDVAGRFDDQDRRRQLSRLRKVSRELADLCAEDYSNLARGYAAVAARADEALQVGFNQQVLNQLSSEWPYGPEWLHPKHPGYDAPWDDDRQRLANLHQEGTSLALDLRTVGVVTDD